MNIVSLVDNAPQRQGVKESSAHGTPVSDVFSL